MKNIIKCSLLIGINLLVCGCSNHRDGRYENLETAFEYSRDNWMGGLVHLLHRSNTGEEIDTKVLSRLTLELIAKDATFAYAGMDVNMDRQWMILAKMLQNARFDESDLNDPLNLARFYEIDPNGPPSLPQSRLPVVLRVSEKAIENKKAYEEFVAWMRKGINDYLAETEAIREEVEKGANSEGSVD